MSANPSATSTSNAKPAKPAASPFISSPACFFATAKRLGDKPGYFVRGPDTWQATSWKDYATQVETAAGALIALGVKAGDAVCLLGFNRPEWVIMDIAAMMIGARAAGIYWTSSAEEVEYVVDHSGCTVLLCENQAQYAKIADRMAHLPQLQRVVLMRGSKGRAGDAMQLEWDAFLALNTPALTAQARQRLAAIKPADCGTLIYTSGTTGPSKGVMLSHASLAWTGRALAQAVHANETDRCISYLPLAHIAEQMNTIHSAISSGCTVYFANSIESLGDHLKEVHPTIFFGVPRVWEKMHSAIATKLAAATGVKAALARWALRVGKRWHTLTMAGKNPGLLLNIQKKLAHKLIHGKIKTALGFDQARILMSGAAPIALENLEFFLGLDIVIREVYGQSEDCGPTSVNLPGATRLGSVGKPLPGAKVKIAADGEILAQGPHVFDGYLKRPEETVEALQNGWLHSGDLGHIDEDGYVFITGRKKDLLITSGGKNISPANIEAALMSTHLIEHAVVCGDGKHFLSAIVTLKADALAAFATAQGLPSTNLHQAPAVLAEVQRNIDATNEHHAKVAAIRKFTILTTQFSVETGELTATTKIRRSKVLEKYRAEVEELYRV